VAGGCLSDESACLLALFFFGCTVEPFGSWVWFWARFERFFAE
jgi:hypothetical protein